MRERALEHLRTVMLPFWKSLRDDGHGGFYGAVDFDLTVRTDAPKGGVLCARILYFFSTATRIGGDADSLRYARHAYEFLCSALLDKERGGVYGGADHAGAPLDTSKRLYNQGFAVYGLAAYALAGGRQEPLDLALKQFRLIETKYRDAVGYREEADSGAPADRKTAGSVLGLLEAYTELYLASRDAGVKEALTRLLELIDEKVIRADDTQFEAVFDEDYRPVGDTRDYGHDAMGVWLADRACEVLGYTAARPLWPGGPSELANRLAARGRVVWDNTLACAMDGGSLDFGRAGGVVNRTRSWWVQAEAVVALLDEWRRTSEPDYRRLAERVFDYCITRLVDSRPGSEWFAEIDERGEPVGAEGIAGPWKCPYHNGRMIFEILRRGIE